MTNAASASPNIRISQNQGLYYIILCLFKVFMNQQHGIYKIQHIKKPKHRYDYDIIRKIQFGGSTIHIDQGVLLKPPPRD